MPIHCRRAGLIIACVALLAGALFPGAARGQTGPEGEGETAPAERTPRQGGSTVFDDGDENVRPPKRAKPPAADPPSRGAGEGDGAGGRQPSGDRAAEPEPAPEPDPSPEREPQAEPDPEPMAEPGPEAERVAERVAVPDKAAQAKALKLVKEVYADEYKKKSAEDKLALAAQLLEQAGGSGNDAASQYVMLREARDLATAGGDIDAAFAAADGLAAAFAGVEAVALKLETLAAASRKVSDPARAEALVDGHLALSAELLADAELDRAVRVVAQAESVARKAKSPELAARVSGRKKELKELVGQYGAALVAAKAKLSKSEADPAANTTVGRFYCLGAGQWDRGLPLLARGNDQPLRKLAAADIAAAGIAGGDGPADGTASLGDAWWEYGEQQKGVARSRARGRAAHWYQQALEKLEGLARTRVEKRLAQVAPEDVASGSTAAAPADRAVQMLKNLVRKLPADARPRKGQAWDPEPVSRWINRNTRATPFDAVLRVSSVNATRTRGRDMVSAYFEPVGPVKLDGVAYRLTVSLYEQTGEASEVVKKLQRGAQVRVRGTTSSMSLGSSGGNGVDITNVDFFVYLDRPNLTLLPNPAVPKAAPDSARRLLAKLAREMPDDLRRNPVENAQTTVIDGWLEPRSRGTPVEQVATVMSVSEQRSGNSDALYVLLEPLGPLTVGETEFTLGATLWITGEENIARLRTLRTGSTVTLRAVVRRVMFNGSVGGSRPSIALRLEPEEGYTITQVSDVKAPRR